MKSQILPTEKGFTLLELMVTLAIIAVLAGLAAPAMRGFTRNQMIVGAITDLSADLQYARSEAVARKTDVEICPSTNGLTCSNSKSWVEGWIIQITDAEMCPAADDCILKAKDKLNVAISINASVASGMTFDDQGATTRNVVFALCDKDRSASSDDVFLRTLFLKTSGTSYVRKGASTCDPV